VDLNGTLRALSVDDEKMNLELIEKMAARLDLEVISFTDPKAALSYLHANRIDIIFIDYMMPEMDGITFMRQVRRSYEDIPMVMITAVTSDSELKLRALNSGATEFLNKPLNLPEFTARVTNLKQLRQSQLLYRNWANLLKKEVSSATREVSRREQETLQVLGSAAEYKDPETGEHILRVAHYSRILAEELTEDEDLQQKIFRAAPLHDIGKIGVPDTILLKPGALTADEFAVMKSHTQKGYEIMQGSLSPYLQMGAEIALTHHEKWDGSGYPRGLSGYDIPLCGRIVAVADVFDAVTSRRPYKEPWDFERAFRLIRAERGRHFAPEAVDAFVKHIEKVGEIFSTYSDGTCEEPACRDEEPAAAQ
jgi:response regulator RpfG family c-di-GMP phosphodiesterase